MRNLQTKDIFCMSRLIMSLNLKEELKNLADKIDKNSNVEALGFEVFFTILGKCTDENSEKKIYDFLSGPLEIKSEEVATMDPIDLFDKIMKIASVEKWKLFLSKASQLIK
ncbi:MULTISPECIES: hypothetical protein [Clostridium]|uniref:hypothetical protein n=1 Tax=Clostridium TaxID=1485 RepID=UPI000BE23FB5|nr:MULTISPECIES: hypothetical protein [Clostridium]MBS4958684.1 hypothetical protein [Clostridium sp.]